jgi:hypothetical protein
VTSRSRACGRCGSRTKTKAERVLTDADDGASRPVDHGASRPIPRRNNHKNRNKTFLMRVGVVLATSADDRKQGQIEQRCHYNGLERLRR